MEQGYDQEQTSVVDAVEPEDYWLRFRVPDGLMPDRQFAGRPARLRVHRVRPVYANGNVPTPAVVLIHGRTVPGPVVFDLRALVPSSNVLLSVQEALAWAGIDTFAPSLLGYGRSTRFDEGLNDPDNASLRPYPPDTTYCPYPEGCDRTLIPGINPYDQQGTMLLVRPLGGQRRAHSSNFRFARTDVWVRDIDQVINDAINKNRETYDGPGPDGNKVALVGYSLGGQHVGRTLYRDNPNEQLLYADDVLNDDDVNDDEVNEDLHNRDEVIDKVSRVVFLNSLFGGPTEDPDPHGRPTFPLLVNGRPDSDALWNRPLNTADCDGRIIDGTPAQVWVQTMENETVGREWGDPSSHPTGLNRSPTFSGYGWNPDVAKQLSPSTLVMQGLLDGVLPTAPGTTPRQHAQAIYQSLPPSTATYHKVLVQVECASHALPWEGCSGPRCMPGTGETPYGGNLNQPWAGPHATLKAALIEWIKDEKFNGEPSGSWIVGANGVVRSAPAT